MITKMLQMIGEHVSDEKDQREQLISSQKPYKGKYIITISIDPTTDKIIIETEEYQKKLEPRYLRGMVGSGGSSLSPTMNIGLDKIIKYKFDKDEDFQAIVVENFLSKDHWLQYLETNGGRVFSKTFKKAVNIKQNIVASLNKSALKGLPETSLAKIYYVWIERKVDVLLQEILFYLLDNWLEYKQNKVTLKKDYPRAIIFKIMDESQNSVFYPGDVTEFIDLYKSLMDSGSKSLDTEVTCFSCNRPTSDINRSTIGIFNLNMTGFVIGFGNQDLTPQFTVCNSCAVSFQEGYNILEEDLKFFAFKTKNGQLGPSGQNVFHYLIPLVLDPKLLKRAVANLKGQKVSYGEKVKRSLQKRISDLNMALERTNRSAKSKVKKLKDQLKRVKKQEAEAPANIAQRADLTEIVSEIINPEIHYLDIYFFVTDAKQNPTTKEVISSLQLSRPSINAIQDALNALSQSNMEFTFYKLSKILPIKLFLSIMDHLYMQKKIDPSEFIREFSKILRQAFTYHIIKQSRKDVPPFSMGIREFAKAYLFLVHANIFQGEKKIMTNTKVTKPKNNAKKSSVKVIDRVNYLTNEFEHPFFVSDDLKAAAGIGLLFNLMRRLQENDLRTRTLIKDTRIWMKELNRESLLKILAECNRVDFIWQDKMRKKSYYTKVRLLIMEYAKQAKWKSTPEALSLAFMLGYDSFSSIYSNEEENEEEEDNEE